MKRLGISSNELSIILVLLCVLLWGWMVENPYVKNRRGRGPTVGAELRRLNAAKSRFTVDHQSPIGAPVTFEHLIQDGYLSGGRPEILGVRFDIGSVGAPATFRFGKPD